MSEPDLRKLMQQVVETTSPPRFLELYYWTQEPGMARLVRRLTELPPEVLGALAAFMDAAAGDPSLTARLRNGRLELKARKAKDALAMLDYMLSDNSDKAASGRLRCSYRTAEEVPPSRDR